MKVAIINFVLVLLLASTLQSETYHVANNGLDSDTCGVKAAPCRTISRAISKANSGDKILVQPGIYGDYNQDDDLDDAGDEAYLESTEAMIAVDKSVRILSTAGAMSTFIKVPSGKDYALYFQANGASLGKTKKGFTVLGGDEAAIFVEGSNVRIISSRVKSSSGAGVLAGCATVEGQETPENRGSPSSGRILNSEISNNTGQGLYLCENTSNWTLRSSEFSNNGSSGATLYGSGHRVNKNYFTANQGYGLEAIDVTNIRVVKNIAIANFNGGVTTGGSQSAILKRVATIGNAGVGYFFFGSGSVSQSNFYSNHGRINSDYSNCGIFDNTADGSVSKNYFGSSIGPGIDPADEVCSQIKNFEGLNFSSKEFKVTLKVPKLG